MSYGNTQAEQPYAVFPVHMGDAQPDLKQHWDHIYDWMAEKHPNALELAQAWRVDADTLENYYESELIGDNFYRQVSLWDCDCCGENIPVGLAAYHMTYPDGTDQEPLCFTCAKEAMENEAVTIYGREGILLTAKVVTDKLQRPYWEVLAWIIAQEVDDETLILNLEQHPDALRRWILCNLKPGAGIW